MPVTSSTSMQNKNSAININETKNFDTSKELLQIARNWKFMQWKRHSLEKNKELEKKTPFLGKLIKENHAKFKYFTGINK